MSDASNVPDHRVPTGEEIVYSAYGVRLAGHLLLEWDRRWGR